MASSAPPSSGTPIDRVEPTRRPAGRPLMYQRWNHLLFLHWRTNRETLAAHLPPGLEVDTFEGQAYVGLVAFTIEGLRRRHLPALPGLSRFHEVNVRTYVHACGRDPGVWFFSLDAANPVAVQAARWAYHLPYYYAWIRLQEEAVPGEAQPQFSFHSVRKKPARRAAGCALRYQTTGSVAPAQSGTLEHFLVERYILYSECKGALFRARVHHTPYPLQTAILHSLEENLLAASDLTTESIVPLVHYAGGVSVEVFPLEPAVAKQVPTIATQS